MNDTSAKRGAWVNSLAFALLALAGCASTPSPTTRADAPPTTTAATHIQDLRGDYRQALCRLLSTDLSCDDVVLRLPGEPMARSHPNHTSNLTTRYRIAFVPGLFADCAEKWLQPFADVVEALQNAGFQTAMLRVAGRASTAQNAAQLAGEIALLPNDGKRLIVFAYSKGLPDVLDLLVRHPGSHSRIAAVVSYAGAANGSPLADDLRSTYEAFLSKMPLSGCAAGTGAELEALRPSVRQAWWQAQHAALHATRVPFFSLVGAPRPDRVSPLLRTNHERLTQHDPNNDSQLLARDAIVPGSALLGYVNADHWAMAIPLSQQLPALSALFRDDLPRAALVSAAIEVVDQALRHAPAPIQ